jgi:hypothetical protein
MPDRRPMPGRSNSGPYAGTRACGVAASSALAILVSCMVGLLCPLAGGCSGNTGGSTRPIPHVTPQARVGRQAYLGRHPELTEAQKKSVLEDGVCLGMSEADVKAIWGPPMEDMEVLGVEIVRVTSRGNIEVERGVSRRWIYSTVWVTGHGPVSWSVDFTDEGKVLRWKR